MRGAIAMLDAAIRQRLDEVVVFPRYGHVTRVASDHLEAAGPLAALGSLCAVHSSEGDDCIAEVSAVSDKQLILIPLRSAASIVPGNRVTALRDDSRLPVGDGFAGRAVDGLGRPIDGLGAIIGCASWASNRPAVATLDRLSPTRPLETGIRAVDMMLSLGIGQRIGIFAAAGVGKTRLVDQIARQTDCDHVIICQVGERGREVEALWAARNAHNSGARLTVVAATSDEPAPMRVRAVEQALAIAEYWRSQGRHVLLIVDSVTRLAMALREVGLASGEPPTVRAYTPNVLKALPRLVERCGCDRSAGAITAIFTVLSETDDNDDPIAEAMKSMLDGHILLSRQLAQLGHFPAIDIARSISRLASAIVPPSHRSAAMAVAAALGRYDESKIVIESGLYGAGSDPALDEAIARRPAIMRFLSQSSDEHSPWDDSLAALARVTGGTAGG